MISFQADTAPVQTYDITSSDLQYLEDLFKRFSDFTIHWNQERDEEPSDPIDQSAILSILREDS